MRVLFRSLALALALGLGAASVPMAADAQTTLRRGLGSSPGTVDPHKADVTQEGWVAIDMFEGLLSHDDRGQPRLALAESMDISPDGKVYTFKLREDAKFSDGTPVTADDVVFSFRRLADPKTLSPYAYFTWPIVNGVDIVAGKADPKTLGVDAVDSRTVRITLTGPTGYFPGQLSHTAMSVVSKANVEKHGDAFIQAGNMVGSGPFTLAEAVPQAYYRLVKNPHYYDADQVKLDAVMHMVTESADTEFRMFRAGELDATSTMPVTQIPWTLENIPDAYKPADMFATFQLWLNMTQEPWKSNPKLRKALALAVDRETLAEKVIFAGTRSAFTFVPPDSVPGYPSPVPDWAKLTQTERDAEAKKLFAEAGYGPGGKTLPLLKLSYTTNENNRRIVVAIAAMLKQKLGIDVELNNQEGRVVADMAENKSYGDMVLFGWIGDYLDPVTFLKIVRSDVGKQNYAGYSNPALDRKIDEANAATDPEKRMALLAEAERMLLDDLPMITTHHNTRRRVVSPKVTGWIPNARDVYPSRYLGFAK